jgi:hypothetical protein
MVLVVGHVYIAGIIDGDTPRRVETTAVTAEATPFGQKSAVTGKLLDPVVAAINYV